MNPACPHLSEAELGQDAAEPGVERGWDGIPLSKLLTAWVLPLEAAQEQAEHQLLGGEQLQVLGQEDPQHLPVVRAPDGQLLAVSHTRTQYFI